MAKRLELKFKNLEGSTVTISLDNPIEPADPVAVKQAMDNILQNDVFSSSGGALNEIYQARIVDRAVTDIPLD
ncbi:DUF2922 domain-containing protein [Tenuibacillus multivorans]|uniref:DUF2922 domain-containing protein n=1 Tax=Tenuibacillus multivorans TaxID=237069 RepID=A0A1G9YDJ1_9BACI|nr:DUF2922 domain-containing protein [Tenuibacillus multivorans]GEL76058.1 hypothetical protein TMU01_02930 [Tenuibacillus multivorans]SDN07189.1 Protein of unknown function [Tenuibacillus multivorans]